MREEVKLMAGVFGWSGLVDIALKSGCIFFPGRLWGLELSDLEGSLKTVSDNTVKIEYNNGVLIVHDQLSRDCWVMQRE